MNKEQTYKGEAFLKREYLQKKKSMQEIADQMGVSLHAVAYWMEKHGIQRRNQSAATYVKRNPNGDPFKIKQYLTEKEKALFYLAIGLYLGEGKKYQGCTSVALGNTDPLFIRVFLKFLREVCGVEERKIRLELNIYDDVDVRVATEYWSLVTELPLSHFSKPVIREARKKGTYKHWSRYGTLTVMVGNKKLYEKMMTWCYRFACDFAGVVGHLDQNVAEIAQLAEHRNGNAEATGSIPVLGSKNYLNKDSIEVFLN